MVLKVFVVIRQVIHPWSQKMIVPTEKKARLKMSKQLLFQNSLLTFNVWAKNKEKKDKNKNEIVNCN